MGLDDTGPSAPQSQIDEQLSPDELETDVDPVNSAALLSAALQYNKKTLEQAFRAFDKSGRGRICYADFEEAAGIIFQHQTSPQEIKGLFNYLNLRKDGEIHWDEWQTCLTTVGAQSQHLFGVAMLLAVLNYNNLSIETGFKELDTSKEGKIGKETFCQLAGELLQNQLQGSQVEELFSYLDMDGDGFINLEEWSLRLKLASEANEAVPDSGTVASKEPSQNPSPPRSPPPRSRSPPRSPQVVAGVVSAVEELTHELAETASAGLEAKPSARGMTTLFFDAQNAEDDGRPLSVSEDDPEDKKLLMMRLSRAEQECVHWRKIAADKLGSDGDERAQALEAQLVMQCERADKAETLAKAEQQRGSALNAQVAELQLELQKQISAQTAREEVQKSKTEAVASDQEHEALIAELHREIAAKDAQIEELRQTNIAEASLMTQIKRNVAKMFEPKLRHDEVERRKAQVTNSQRRSGHPIAGGAPAAAGSFLPRVLSKIVTLGEHKNDSTSSYIKFFLASVY